MANDMKLELTWVDKNKKINPEPRILVENKKMSYERESKDLFGTSTTDNMLIHGDNLLALKALEAKYAGKVKCVYIDPPYNTGSAFEHYDDNLEHSIWLNLMKSRLDCIKKLLSDNGAIAVQIDSNEFAHIKLVLDEVFGSKNFVNIIVAKAKVAGVSGSNLGKSLQDNLEFILLYAKDISCFSLSKIPQKKQELMNYINSYQTQGKSWKYTSVIKVIDEGTYVKSFFAGNGDEIKLFKHEHVEICSINQIAKDEFNGNLKEAYYKYIDKIFRTTNAQTSIRTKVMDETKEYGKLGFYSIEYAPIKGKNAGNVIRSYYKDNNLIAWLKDVVEVGNDKIIKLDVMGNLWDDIQYNNLTKEGNIQFPNGKKPELLVSRILDMISEEGDIVLDSFLGSGTTAAVAHKMKRRWIGIELGNHAYTHCKNRLDNVINGEDLGGVTRNYGFNGGGGYKFYELAPTLIKIDSFGQEIINPEYNAEMLSSAVAIHEGYKYNPDSSCYWKQATNEGNSYLFVTTNHVNRQIIDSILMEMKEDEYLVIICKSFDANATSGVKNITIKKIPQSLLKNCEFGVDNYNLNIVCPPTYEEDEDDE